MKFNSIRMKMLRNILVPFIIAFTILAVTIGIYLNSYITNQSEADLESSARESAKAMDAALAQLEIRMQNLVAAAVSCVDEELFLSGDTEYFKKYEKTMEQMTIDFAADVDGLVSSYIRYVPALTHGTSGTFYTLVGTDTYETVVPTDLGAYDRDDTEHVGWFYTPLDVGEASWLAPYYNANIDKMIISYCIPFYLSDGSDFGIVGIDFDFTMISDMLNENNPYKTGESFLTDDNGNFLFHPKYVNGENISSVENGKYAELAKLMKSDSNGHYIKRSGKKLLAGFAQMNNGWNICILPEYSEIYSSINTLMIVTILSMLVILAIVVFLVIVMSNSITLPITKLAKATTQMADGDLNVEVDVQSDNEIGALADATTRLATRLKTYIEIIEETAMHIHDIGQGNLNLEFKHSFDGDFAPIREYLEITVDRLNDMLGQIRETADIVVADASEITNVADNAASCAVIQVQAANDLLSTIEDLSQYAKQNANDSLSVNDSIVNTITKVEQSNGYMQELTEAMEEINNSSEQIVNIIKAINDIAFQTNILSLNASIEAARAGVAGRGFSVVADEVRNLATKTADAASETAELIAASARAVANGKDLVDSTAAELASTVEAIKGLSASVGKITEASNKQSIAISGLNEGIEQVTTTAQSNKEAAENTTDAGTRLSDQSNRLHTLVASFELVNQ